MEKVTIIECPRDAMQGLHDFIPTALKVEYLNLLLKCGFDVLDFGSFVSPKAIPQMRDTAEVLNKLVLQDTKTKLLAIVANERGATDACSFDEISCFGFPLSLSETFQHRNTNATIEEAWTTVEKLSNLANLNKKEFVVYLSMGFGNPYGDSWNVEKVASFSKRLIEDFGVSTISLSDTIGCAKKEDISQLWKLLQQEFPQVEFGAHLHTNPLNAKETIEVALEAGCRRFDGAIKGFGGCPMAADTLTGNMPTEVILEVLKSKGNKLTINEIAFNDAYRFSSKIFI
jgi:hydroxymethylglutaryl-CoA lyase